LQARLRGLGLDGHALAVQIDPGLPRSAIREARTADARRRREGTPPSVGIELALNDEARLGWTPEVLARRMGERAAGRHVVDACCGAGGNAIGFALSGCRVTAIERDAEIAELARMNASRYGVADRIEFMVGDALEHVPGLEADILFIDPPWGTDWDRQRTTAGALTPLLELLDLAEPFGEVWSKVPSSFDVGTLPGSWTVTPVFGEGPGDERRIKFLWLCRETATT
jgi:SAM-dependent methyltransferase